MSDPDVLCLDWESTSSQLLLAARQGSSLAASLQLLEEVCILFEIDVSFNGIVFPYTGFNSITGLWDVAFLDLLDNEDRAVARRHMQHVCRAFGFKCVVDSWEGMTLSFLFRSSDY